MTAKKDDAPVPLTTEEKAKVKAETAKLQAETEAAQYDAMIKAADAAVAVRLANAGLAEQQALARGAAAAAKEAEISMRALERNEKAYLALDKFHKVYAFTQPVGEKSVGQCIGQLTEWMRTDPGCAIEIVFNSPGGSVIDGMALYDFIQTLRVKGHHVTTSTIGMAASMAGILLQAGDKRVMGREAYLLIHEVASAAIGKMGEIEDEVKFLHMIQERILNVFAERSKLTKAELRRHWKKTDWWLDSDQALKYGLVDEVR